MLRFYVCVSAILFGKMVHKHYRRTVSFLAVFSEISSKLKPWNTTETSTENVLNTQEKLTGTIHVSKNVAGVLRGPQDQPDRRGLAADLPLCAGGEGSHRAFQGASVRVVSWLVVKSVAIPMYAVRGTYRYLRTLIRWLYFLVSHVSYIKT